MSKNNSRTFGGNRKGPGYRTASSFRIRKVVKNRLGKNHLPGPAGK
jgi:hypothetical protein